GRWVLAGTGGGRAGARGPGIDGTRRLWAAGHERDSLPQVARVRRRGYGALLFAPSPRGGPPQSRPQEDHRAGHRLAFPQRAPEGVEGMNSRRTFLKGVALVGTVGLQGLRPRSAWAGPPFETGKMRIAKHTTIAAGCTTSVY